MKLCKSLLILLVYTINSYAQQFPQFTQYMYNTISINPAYAGSRNVLSVVGIHRSQWAGLENGPETQTLSAHTPLRNDNLGIGATLIRDQLGYENFTYVYGDFSYTISLNSETKLALGLKAGFTQYNLDEELLVSEAADPLIANLTSGWNPNIGAGILAHTDKWYVGFSAPRLINVDHNQFKIGNVDYAVVDRLVYFLTGGYVFDLNYTVKFKPSFLVKATNGAPLSYDITGNFLFNEKFWLGGSYRINNNTGALGALVDFQINKQMRVGYSYEHPLSDINTYSNGTHEVLLMFEFNKINRVKSPRYF
ncbi:PorP/SprF family type IX secretion system membrane protein [Tenacibaculum agarivorans]|uniref:PorP/SprF family type IX secretion system membrane protein n=1 Tax=Tenacibaculum agarivorans TaxID=1908389 RepID=UPI00094B8A9E|nr:type IX secretion system membrane protein PorP/SprF [Tenacibaculum agarivorans]